MEKNKHRKKKREKPVTYIVLSLELINKTLKKISSIMILLKFHRRGRQIDISCKYCRLFPVSKIILVHVIEKLRAFIGIMDIILCSWPLKYLYLLGDFFLLSCLHKFLSFFVLTPLLYYQLVILLVLCCSTN